MPEVGRFLFLHSESSCSFYRNENGVVIGYGKLGQIDIGTLHRVGFERVTTNRDKGKETEKDTTTTPSTPSRRCPQDRSLHSHSHNRTGNRSSAASPAGTSSSCVLPCDTVHTSSLSASSEASSCAGSFPFSFRAGFGDTRSSYVPFVRT